MASGGGSVAFQFVTWSLDGVKPTCPLHRCPPGNEATACSVFSSCVLVMGQDVLSMSHPVPGFRDTQRVGVLVHCVCVCVWLRFCKERWLEK